MVLEGVVGAALVITIGLSTLLEVLQATGLVPQAAHGMSPYHHSMRNLVCQVTLQVPT